MLLSMLRATTILLIAVKLSCSINWIQTDKSIFKESMCIAIEHDGQYDIRLLNSRRVFKSVSVEINENANESIKNMITKFKDNFHTVLDDRHKIYYLFDEAKLKYIRDIFKNGIYDKFSIYSEDKITFSYDNYYNNRYPLDVFLINIKNGTIKAYSDFVVSKVTIEHTSQGVTVHVTRLQNTTWSKILPGFVLWFVRIHQNMNISIDRNGSTFITMSKECLDLCKLKNTNNGIIDGNASFNETRDAHERNIVLGELISNTQHGTYEIKKELSSKFINNSFVIYRTIQNSTMDISLLSRILRSPWYYLEYPGYSLKHLISLCNDVEGKDCYKVNLNQTYRDKVLITFVILQENKYGKIYLFEKYRRNILILKEIQINKIKFVKATIFNHDIDDYYEVLNQMNIVVKDCKKDRRILQAFHPLPVSIHQNSICVIEESGNYKVICESDGIRQSVDIKVTGKIEYTNGVPYKELSSNLFGRFERLTDSYESNYSIFERRNLFTFLHSALSAHNGLIEIIQDEIITINFELVNAHRTIIEISMIDIHTANLQTILLNLSVTESRGSLNIMPNNTIKIDKNGVKGGVVLYNDVVVYHISYRTDVHAELTNNNSRYDLTAKTLCY